MTRFLQNVYFDVVVVFFNRVVFKDSQARRGHQDCVHVDGSSVLGRTGQARMARTMVLFT